MASNDWADPVDCGWCGDTLSELDAMEIDNIFYHPACLVEKDLRDIAYKGEARINEAITCTCGHSWDDHTQKANQDDGFQDDIYPCHAANCDCKDWVSDRSKRGWAAQDESRVDEMDPVSLMNTILTDPPHPYSWLQREALDWYETNAVEVARDLWNYNHYYVRDLVDKTGHVDRFVNDKIGKPGWRDVKENTTAIVTCEHCGGEYLRRPWHEACPFCHFGEAKETGSTVTLRSGYGYYATDDYPIGGSFRRAVGDMPIVITRSFAPFKGCDLEGKTADGKQVAFGYSSTVEGEAERAAQWEAKEPSLRIRPRGAKDVSDGDRCECGAGGVCKQGHTPRYCPNASTHNVTYMQDKFRLCDDCYADWKVDMGQDLEESMQYPKCEKCGDNVALGDTLCPPCAKDAQPGVKASYYTDPLCPVCGGPPQICDCPDLEEDAMGNDDALALGNRDLGKGTIDPEKDGATGAAESESDSSVTESSSSVTVGGRGQVRNFTSSTSSDDHMTIKGIKARSGIESDDPEFNPCPAYKGGSCRVDGRICPYSIEDFKQCGKYPLAKTLKASQLAIQPGEEDDVGSGFGA